MRLRDVDDVVTLMTAESLGKRKLQRIEPELGSAVVTLDVDVRRLETVSHVKKEAVTALAEYRWHISIVGFMKEKMKALTCPVCGKPVEFDAPPTGFFCSDRCKMIDLGKWLGEDYRISEPLRPDHFEDSEGMSGEGLDATERG